MDLAELFPILRAGEGTHTEFKSDFTKQAHDVAKELAALANSGGGVLLLGAGDDGSITGIPGPDRAIERLAGIARSCKPPLLPEIGKLQVGDNLYIVYAKLSSSITVPHLYQGKFFVRVGSCTEEASGGDELIRLLKNLGSPVFQPTDAPFSLFLPPPAKGFKGRTGEIERLDALLLKKSVAMVIIEGISGIGKTALSAYFASTVEQHGYRSFWLDCRPDTSFDSAVLALAAFERYNKNGWIADILEDVTVSIEERTIRIAAGLAREKIALFFDDYQFVCDPLINRLLQKLAERALEAKIFLVCRWRPQLVASISPVQLVEEPLRVGLDIDSCNQLLVECGLSVSTETVTSIWRLTGEGHPKALEIFIARSRTYPVSGLLSSLPIFREELMNEWLTPLMNELPEEEKSIAIELSVFDRAIPQSALKKLYPASETDQLVTKLVDRFILNRAPEASLRMHLLIREFCYALIPDKSSKHLWAANYYLTESGSELDPEKISNDQLESLVGAWSHLLKAQDYAAATDVLNRMRPSLMSRGLYEQVMFLIEQTPTSEADADWFTIHKSRILSLWGEFDSAVALIHPLLDSPEEELVREAILVLATIYNDHNQGDRARELLESHHDRFVKNKSARIQRRFLSRLVEAYSLLGNLDQALSWASKISQACEAEGDEISGAISLRQMAAVSKAQRKPEIALSLCQLSHSLLAKHGRVREAALTERLLASTYVDLGDYESAVKCLKNSLEAFTRMGDRKNSTICRQQLSHLPSALLSGGQGSSA